MNVNTNFSYKALVMNLPGDGTKIATMNSQGLATLSKRPDDLNFIKQKNLFIICLRNMHFVLDT